MLFFSKIRPTILAGRGLVTSLTRKLGFIYQNNHFFNLRQRLSFGLLFPEPPMLEIVSCPVGIPMLSKYLSHSNESQTLPEFISFCDHCYSWTLHLFKANITLRFNTSEFFLLIRVAFPLPSATRGIPRFSDFESEKVGSPWRVQTNCPGGILL